jgi:CRP/FNR family transcriptional regulator, nitrogen oxide reductase regulator
MAVLPPSLADVARKSSFLAGLAPYELKSILKAATTRRVPRGSVVIHQGDQVRNLYLMLSGRARHCYFTPGGGKIIFNLIMPGELFGGAAILPSMDSHLVSVEALQPSCALAWSRETIRHLILRHPKLVYNALSIVGGYVEWLLTAHIRLACDNAQFRVAQILVNLAREVGSTAREGTELVVTNEELAHAASVTPFTVSRLVRQWHRSGALIKARGKIILRSPQRLFDGKA